MNNKIETKKKTRNLENLSKKFDVFIFDWDGTLTELKILRTLDQKYGVYWFYKQLRYGKYKHAKLNEKFNKKDSKFEEFKEYILSIFADFYLTLFKPKLHNNVIEMLKLLKQKNKKVILFTNGTEWRIKRELEIFNIQDLFDDVVSAQKLKVIKPNPTGLNKIIKEHHMKKSRIIYVGDMVDDIVMAKAANVSSCAILGGFDDKISLMKAEPDFIFSSIEELLKNL
ncbi:MAG: HAD-IA family hydrolase [Candidatus Marsarchaeota archaeon]|nr:HAD-IA family hydrolase [Candidatus Marsarchaeota archaeon]